MRHFASRKFWQCFQALPHEVRQLAHCNYDLLKKNPAHPSLQFKLVCSGRFKSVRVGLHYRAPGVPVPEGVQWFWIGSHAEYDQIIG
ncbi:MAG TPA: hypothetical protein P5102_01050 [Candidatus Competibacteraceae bacterium]|nr:hypothetical protein [Candidatus Competibacteraceae bacterium]HRZ04734.1 hypothetical protein [Candidatus Competibacteraceae bacterium]HSA46494.1 hypothetical protein [Candidatus Competibacteraceae bacterium]